ncbi:MAG: hypothetical protein IKO49_06290 [Bacilli bacterium]|nr:hypothetical protein [Bacilli bacterium]
MKKCPNCGSELRFDPKSQEVICLHCDSMFNPEELTVTEKHASEQNMFESGKAYTCSQCGATLMTFDETAITFCSYCDSQAMIESKMKDINHPDYIIPFSVTKEEAIKKYKSKVSKSLFIPSYMKSDAVVNKFRGIYMPYAIYKTKSDSTCTNKGSKFSHSSGNYDYYDDYTITSEVDATYEGMSYDLLSKYYDKYSESLPFDFKQVKPFNSNYLIGFYADTKDVEEDRYNSEVCNKVSKSSYKFMKKRKEFSKYGCSKPKAKFHVEETKIGMFPVYFLSVKSKDNEHINYAVVNGQTGDVVIEFPIDFKKYIFLSLILVAPLYFLLTFLPVITAKAIASFSILSSFIGIYIFVKQKEKMNINEKHLDDKGYLSKTETKKEQTKKQTKNDMNKILIIISIIGSLIGTLVSLNLGIVYLILALLIFILNKSIKRQLITILIPTIILILNPVNDIYYYISAFIAFILIILSFYSLIKEHNKLVTSKLPQLEKRGGDENE